MTNKTAAGHLSALLTSIIWGTTFISTKILLRSFSPVEIMFFRFVIAYAALLVIYPHRLKINDRKHELLFAGAGLFGITLYYMVENVALTYSFASNLGVIIAVSPFFTAVLAHFFLNGEKLTRNFFIGFVVAIAGILLIGFNGAVVFELNPVGDLLEVLAALLWAVYSIFTRKLGVYGYNMIGATRRMFFYALIFMLPAVFISDFRLGFERLAEPVALFNLLFLSLAASALCFVSWNLAVKLLGAVKTSLYIYLVPVITVITAAVVLHEQITWMAALGTLLTLTGLFVSERRPKRGDVNPESRNEKAPSD